MSRNKSIFHFERLVISIAITMVLFTGISFGLGVKGGDRIIHIDTEDIQSTN